MRKWVHILLLQPALLNAQLPTATLDTAIIRIGEQAILTLAVDWPADARMPAVVWPTIGDTLTRHVEVVKRSAIDTIHEATDGGETFGRLVLRLTITSFDTGFWALPPFSFQIGPEELASTAMLLEVRGTPLDEGGELRDIRDIHEAPFDLVYTLQRFAPWIMALVALAVIILLVRRSLERRRLSPKTSGDLPPPPALHERILAELRMLQEERLWQNGEHKSYHARLTDLLRTYVEERYFVPARERTTDELLLQLRLSAMSNDQRERLANILRLADLVKFAKARPSAIENEQAMSEAMRLVQETAVYRQDVSPTSSSTQYPLPSSPNKPHAR